VSTPGQPPIDLRIGPFRQRIAALEAENARLQKELEDVQRSTTDVSLAGLVGSLAAAAAVTEAAVPGRAVVSLGLTLRSYLALDGGALGVRFVPPELTASPVGLSTTTIELAKVPPAEGGPPPNLHAVLESKQRVFADPAFQGVGAAARVVAEAGTALATASSWSLESIVQLAASIGSVEQDVASALAGRRPAEELAAFSSAVEELVALASTVAGRGAVAADVSALAAALEATTVAAAAFL
jgi:hypothetical protein